MKLDDFNRNMVGVHAASDLHKLHADVSDIAASKLSEEDKELALKEYQRFKKMIITFSISYTLLIMLCTVIIATFLPSQIECTIIFGIVAALFVLVFSIIWRRKNFSNFARCRKLVAYGWDGLTEEQIALLQPDKEDEKELRSKTVKEVIFWSLFILYCVAWFIFVRPVEIWIWLKIIILIVPLFFIYMQVDDVSTEKVRIKSGYYKRNLLNETKNETEIDEDEEINLFN